MKKEAVCGIVFKADEVLLIKRRDIPVWVLPGGGIDEGETPEAAVVREIEEETGFKTKILRKAAEYLPANKLTHLTHYFECTILTGKATISNESQEVKFFPLKNLPPLPPPYKGWIEDACEKKPFIRKKIEGTSYLNLIKFLFKNPVLTIRFLLTKIGIHIND